MQTCDMRERLEFHRSFGVLRCRAGFKSLDNFVITSHERANMNGTRQNHSCRVWGRQSQAKTASSHSILPLLAFCLLLSTLYAIVVLSYCLPSGSSRHTLFTFGLVGSGARCAGCAYADIIPLAHFHAQHSENDEGL